MEEHVTVKFSKLTVDHRSSSDSNRTCGELTDWVFQAEWSLKNGDESELEKILNSIPFECLNAALSRPALVIAADYGHDHLIRFIIRKGASIDEQDRFGITPLLAAIWENQLKVIVALLEAGANAKLLSPAGKTYVEEAECVGNAVLEIMIPYLESISKKHINSITSVGR